LAINDPANPDPTIATSYGMVLSSIISSLRVSQG
jgi:hypothetical protein